jgi:fluoride exporter
MVKTIAMIALGGACGSVLRHFMNSGILTLFKTAFPVGILSINILGSFAMGVLVALFANSWNVPEDVRLFLTVGVLGGFTTFSAFSLDAMMLWSRGDAAGALLYVGLSVILSIAAVFLGSFLVMRYAL